MKWTPSDMRRLEWIARMPRYDRKEEIAAMAQDRKCCYDHIRKRVAEVAVSIGVSQPMGKVISEEHWDLIRSEVECRTMEVHELAKICGVSQQVLLHRMRHRGLKFPPKSMQPQDVPPPPTINGHDPKVRESLYQGRVYENIRTRPQAPKMLGRPVNTSMCGSAAEMCAR